jgi:hypothetical protein
MSVSLNNQSSFISHPCLSKETGVVALKTALVVTVLAATIFGAYAGISQCMAFQAAHRSLGMVALMGGLGTASLLSSVTALLLAKSCNMTSYTDHNLKDTAYFVGGTTVAAGYLSFKAIQIAESIGIWDLICRARRT